MIENWKQHPYWNAYEVSDKGRVRRSAGGQGAVVGKILKSRICYGYPTVCMNPGHKHRGIHQLVLETFVGKPKIGQVCRHLNGKKTDNKIKNLIWGTPSENYADSIEHGTAARHEKHGKAKLDIDQVYEIRLRYFGSNTTQRALAKEYGLNHSTVQSLLENRTWRDV